MHRRLLLVAALAVTTSTLASTQDRARRPLSSADIDDIAILVKLEDMRRADEAALGRILQSTHAEVRRRAAIAIGRIADRKSGALLVSARADAGSEVAASVVFATGQLKDPDAVPWLSAVLSTAGTVPTVAREAAVALGKFSIPAARAALADYLMTAPATTRSAPVVGEALLSIGRFTTREDLSPIVRWTTAPDVEVRWRAAWALFRPSSKVSATIRTVWPSCGRSNSALRLHSNSTRGDGCGNPAFTTVCSATTNRRRQSYDTFSRTPFGPNW